MKRTFKMRIKCAWRHVTVFFLNWRYPFLKHYTDGYQPKVSRITNYYYQIPDGWRKAFGLRLCEELREELKHRNCLSRYRITDIKEKYGSLSWSDFGAPVNSKILHIWEKYEARSMQTCIHCGKPATYLTTGWISPYCDRCLKKYTNKFEIEHAEKITK